MREMKRKALVTGANGMLGTALCPVLRHNGYSVIATDIQPAENNMEYLDVTDLLKIREKIKEYKPDIIFHLAAETDVDKAETEVNHAYLVNTLGTENIALVCQEFNIELVYISTASVFDGEKDEPYTEFDRQNPKNIYGKTKWEGENIVKDLMNRYFIVRASWMMGGKEKDKKFVAKIIKLLEERKEISVVNDKFGNPTFTEDLSRCLVKLIETKRHGTYHMSNQGVCSRYEIACKIKEYLGKDKIRIKPVTSESFPLLAPRPRSEGMENFKLNLLGLNTMRPWQEALYDYVTNYYMKGEKRD